jgi:hypothetical protein
VIAKARKRLICSPHVARQTARFKIGAVFVLTSSNILTVLSSRFTTHSSAGKRIGFFYFNTSISDEAAKLADQEAYAAGCGQTS